MGQWMTTESLRNLFSWILILNIFAGAGVALWTGEFKFMAGAIMGSLAILAALILTYDGD
jgi:hypothetical protein